MFDSLEIYNLSQQTQDKLIYFLAMSELIRRGKEHRVICVDFDGTITLTDNYPAIALVNEQIVEALKYLHDIGFRIILSTCREDDYLDRALDACEAVDLHFDAVNDNLPERIEQYGSNCRKISADEYWDDKSVRI